MSQPDLNKIDEDGLPKNIKIIRLKQVSIIEISQSSLKVMKMAFHSSPEPMHMVCLFIQECTWKIKGVHSNNFQWLKYQHDSSWKAS